MTAEDSGALPIAQPPGGDPIVSAGLEIAMRWGDALGADKLDIALKALEPELRRAHRERMTRLEMQRQSSEREFAERREQRAHRRHLAGMVVGGVISVAMLGAGVFVAADAWWLAALLCGPSLLALAKVFVLSRSDPEDMKAVSVGGRGATNAAAQAQPPAQPPVV
ncbi:hypothetical protein [Streptomyces sp. NRRL B-1381]|uniref:hypothetical protein n=1 Tax=Streptomyces sp. NRRL B-1381 TaxID=1463829 RepID=UPI0004C22660|nr:hypothetical protein [Streptomyces sp. NRRL B-1381]